jgi:hypothetical protein
VVFLGNTEATRFTRNVALNSTLHYSAIDVTVGYISSAGSSGASQRHDGK